MKNIFICALLLFVALSLSSCKMLNKVPAEPAEFAEAAKKAGFGVSAIDPGEVAAIKDAKSAQVAKRSGCSLYYAIFAPDYFDMGLSVNVNGVKIQAGNGHSPEKFVDKLFHKRKPTSHSQVAVPGKFFIKSASSNSNFFYAGIVSNTFLYFDGSDSCEIWVNKVVDALNY